EAPGDVAAEVMAFAQAGCELVVIDGGDGTVRQVLSALPAAFGDHPPLLSVVASGKTNILAFDLGVRGSWTLDAALAALDDPDARIRLRSPLQVVRDDGAEPPLMGFVFGCAALVRQEALASSLHRAHVFHNLSVALTLAGAGGGGMGGGGDGGGPGGRPGRRPPGRGWCPWRPLCSACRSGCGRSARRATG